MSYNWDCPYCDRAQTVIPDKEHRTFSIFEIGDHALGTIGISSHAIACSNQDCRQVTVTSFLAPCVRTPQGYSPDRKNPYSQHCLMPESSSKQQPEYIPEPLREDYFEACKIRDLSPKASATLSRRCLQGLIRDFCGVKSGTLFNEINALRELVEAGKAPSGVSIDSVDAIDHVRSVGNIGAHMEKDINHIVPVEPEEAQLLIELTESLFEEWYVAKHTREERFSRIRNVAESKKTLIEDHKNLQLPPPNMDKV